MAAGHPKPVRRYVFRLDANARLGMGHLQRCLAIARALKAAGDAEICFVSDAAAVARHALHAQDAVDAWQLPGERDAADLVGHAKRFAADALVLDHYGVDEAYQRAVLEAGIPWLQFQGQPTQRLWARWIVAASPAANPEAYRPLLLDPGSLLLLGPAYAAIRPEFVACRQERRCPERIAHLVLTFGGGDDRGAAICALSAWKMLPERPRLTLLATSANPRLAEIAAWMAEHGAGMASLAVDAAAFAQILASADLAITAGGTTLFETAFLGVPALVVRIADNQDANTAAWERLGVVRDAGPLAECTPAGLACRLEELDRDWHARCLMSREGMQRVDGRGAARIAAALAAGTLDA